jgi:hypothetical protein
MQVDKRAKKNVLRTMDGHARPQQRPPEMRRPILEVTDENGGLEIGGVLNFLTIDHRGHAS